MTDEERKEAERLAADYGLGHRHLKTSQHFIDGYAAACEAKREAIESICDQAAQEVASLDHDLFTEQAWSKKLLDVIKFNMLQWGAVVERPESLTAWQKCRDAIAEYEAARD